ncbi:MAG: hypothetical protein RLZZ546_851 [Bacteroidota bacterium]|jgi:nudix-type nucleoside diphosphatase (YffH/AdpP family)
MKAKILEKNILSNRWADYSEYTIEYIRSDGRVEKHVREIHDTGNGASVLLYNLEKREVLLIQQFRLATLLNENESGIILETVAGLIENEDPHSSIIREIKEETGLIIHDVNFLFKGYATPGAKTEIVYFFAAPYDESTIMEESGGLIGEQEDIILKYMPFDEAYNGIKSGLIVDMKTICLLQYAKLNIFH